LKSCEVIFDLDAQEEELRKIDKMMSSKDFWQKDQDRISQLSQERSVLKETIDTWQALHSQAEDARIMADMAREEDDEITLKEVFDEIRLASKKVKRLQLDSLLSEPDDKRNAIVAINAGAGGTEAQDWVEMLFRMYTRWAETRGMKSQVIDYLPGDEAGIKNVTFTISGDYAYGNLKSEHGIHRMVRISPFDATKRRHTSFASVSVLPEIDNDIVIEVDENDLRIDTFRASGPGGQHVNKTSSAIRITHLPSGIVTQCQNEKSQHRNKDMAMKVLKSKLYDIERNKLEQKKHEMHDTSKDISWGSQIRSYVFNPYQLVKDHRTNTETGNVERVMDGDIETFIDAYLRRKNR